MRRLLSYDELLEIAEQLPVDEGDVFNMHTQQEYPKSEFGYLYYQNPSKKDTVTLSLDKRKYSSLEAARARATELFVTRKLVPYHMFQTSTYYCWYCSAALPEESES